MTNPRLKVRSRFAARLRSVSTDLAGDGVVVLDVPPLGSETLACRHGRVFAAASQGTVSHSDGVLGIANDLTGGFWLAHTVPLWPAAGTYQGFVEVVVSVSEVEQRTSCE